jgi:catechol 2,3-dioxygenase-like lactoylglutathione lyase family enzyme
VADSEPAEHLPLVHLNLTVSDLDRSTAFYAGWFGFDRPPQTMDDGTRFLRNADGFDLALRPGSPPTPPAPTLHLGFRASEPTTVRELLSRLAAAGVPITEVHDDIDHVSFKCLDPDGYEIEVYWDG